MVKVTWLLDILGNNR